MKQPLMIRPRLPGGGLGPPVKAFDHEKTTEEILKRENELLVRKMEETDKMLVEFIEYMMGGGM